MSDMASSNVYAVNFSFGKICRLCLGTSDLVSLEKKVLKNGKSQRETALAKKISNITGVKIVENDTFPNWICKHCVKKLNDAASFIRTSRQTQGALEEKFVQTLHSIGCTNQQIQEIISLRGVPKKNSNPEIEEEEILIQMSPSTKNRKRKKLMLVDENDPTVEYLDPEPTGLDGADEFIPETAGDHDYLPSQTSSTCPICKTALLPEVLDYHLKCHKAAPPLKTPRTCRYCSKSLKGDTLRNHLETFHRVTKLDPLPASYDCKICLRPLSQLYSLHHHYERCHADQLEAIAPEENCFIAWTCKDCETNFAQEYLYIMHCARSHGKLVTDAKLQRRMLPCTETCQCGYIRTGPLEDKVHEVFLHSEELEDCPCPACGLVLSDREALQEHLVKAHYFLFVRLEKTCILCDASFDDFYKVKVHLEKEHEVNYSEQETIAAVKDTREMKLTELQTVELATGEIIEVSNALSCSVCNSFFETNEDFIQHKCNDQSEEESLKKSSKKKGPRAGVDSERSKCPLCSKVYPSKYNLSRHYHKSHLKEKGIKRFSCPSCPKKFVGKFNLQLHEETVHRGIYRFQCPDCPKAFGVETALKKHSEIHMDVRPMYHCDVCGRDFHSHSGFTRHVILHGGTKEYKCDYCEKAFFTSHEVRRHMKYHTQELDYACNFCGRKFLIPAHLRNHITAVHARDSVPRRKRRH